MKLILDGTDKRYQPEQLLLSLFPDAQDDFTAYCRVERSDGRFHAFAQLSRDGKNCNGDYESADEADAVKRAVFAAAASMLGSVPEWGCLSGVRPAKLARYMLEGGMDVREAYESLRRDYFLSEEKADLCLSAGLTSYNTKKLLVPDTVQVYVGVPFCPTRCVYCSFVSSNAGDYAKNGDNYVDCLCRELSSEPRLSAQSVYFGGGTPTMLSAAQLRRVTDALADGVSLSALREYTVEAGRPDTIDSDKLTVLKDAGVSRLSVNPQTSDDSTLKLIGRTHTFRDTDRACALVRKHGFGCLNMDLIAGLPFPEGSDPLELFMRSVRDTLAYSPENLTVHTLCIKRSSSLRFSQASLPDAQTVSEMLKYARAELTSAGYYPYYLYRQKYMTGSFENIGWTKRGFESLYNICMMEELSSVVSYGAGGVTKLVNGRDVRRFHNHKYAFDYCSDFDAQLEKKRLFIGSAQ